MANLTVGIGEYKISNNESDIIKTYALGSCVALMIYDKINKVAGMIHIALPESSVNLDKARALPGYFADTGIPILIEEMKKFGSVKKNIWIKIAGGAKVMDPNSVFDIGKRNILAIKKILWNRNLGPIAEDVGGDFSRTVSLLVDTGEVILSSGNRSWNI
ncbi:MAG: chemotaxis protein CheD [Spirochaetes bacterium GWD1_27_9]|nr:MAG: chemotaxis protein CheD [Spirochaetes bacterium GWB1_27_13]OHD26690.1 MAG: chemotaxis protein CheD [Spirochaetes bacterium GWC1_27_15]OHD35530.1 MAG: chemotaxis protein CheD [Spirochaetes bacterium GWD1_27_9]